LFVSIYSSFTKFYNTKYCKELFLVVLGFIYASWNAREVCFLFALGLNLLKSLQMKFEADAGVLDLS